MSSCRAASTSEAVGGPSGFSWGCGLRVLRRSGLHAYSAARLGSLVLRDHRELWELRDCREDRQEELATLSTTVGMEVALSIASRRGERCVGQATFAIISTSMATNTFGNIIMTGGNWSRGGSSSRGAGLASGS